MTVLPGAFTGCLCFAYIMYKPSHLNSRRSAFRRRSLLLKLLLTALWTATMLLVGLFAIKKILERPLILHRPYAADTAGRAHPAPVPLPPPAPPLAPPFGGTVSGPGSLALVKKGRSLDDGHDDRRDHGGEQGAPLPRLRPVTSWDFGSSFAFNRNSGKRPRASEERRPSSDEAVLLSPSALRRKVWVKGAEPVSERMAKRYSGIDRAAEKLREKRLEQEEAEASARRLLRQEQLEMSGLVLLAFIALTLIGSRVIHALRLLERPDGAHWTLK